MKKLTKKQKAEFPMYIARIDINASAYKDYEAVKGFYRGYYIKAMEEKNLVSAISKLDEVIREYGEDIYLTDLIGKTDREDENGYPIYELVLRSRTHIYSDGRVAEPSWHIADENHSESDDYDYKWYPYKDRFGDLEYIEKVVA